MKNLKIHKFPFKNVIVLAIECKMYLRNFTAMVVFQNRSFFFHFLSFNGVFLTLKCRTHVLKHLHGDRAAPIVLKMDIRH